MPPQRNRLRELLATYLLPHRGLVASLTLFLFSSIGLQLLNPQIMRGFIDAARSEDISLEEVLQAGFLFLAIAARYVSERLAWTATNARREDLALHCLRLDSAPRGDDRTRRR